ncbi:DUF4153 domain-containing protein [Amycolatopsis rhizosphaerae]|uniref:DUF4153 domain-containing protein n=1 Tax=Amycolatopsis rhizosphaerae TaxID=2053003 RepID=UPI00164393FA|nr:DUF4153 domain-containing protein [Amycolatopsis rhizosphaerae]
MIAAGVRMKWDWLPRAIPATCLAAVLGLALADPEGIIAKENVARSRQTGLVDLSYLSGLSEDVVPALGGLPEPLRCRVLWQMSGRLDPGTDGWLGFNAARAAARQALADARPGC